MQTHQFKVQDLPEDPRLDKVIPLYVKALSRTRARSLIEEGSVYVNQKRCHQNAKPIKAGDSIKIFVAEEKTAAQKEEQNFVLTPPAILFEDKDFIVVNKPPGLPTHETIDQSRFHLALAVQEYLAKKQNIPVTKAYLGIHHRLDRDTSGALLFTKSKEANPPVAQAFQNQEVAKTYLAVCLGKPPTEKFTVQNFLGPSPRNKRKFCSVRSGGKPALTEFRLVAQITKHGKTISLMEAKPKTGRTHQIRVHLSEAGLPIVGDSYYGVEFPGISRVMLHAHELRLLGKTFTAPLPDDFLALAFPQAQA